MKRKKTPPSEHIVSGLAAIQPGHTIQETRQEINSFLTINVMYGGDMKQLAERYGCHYLKSKRMRTRELQQWIVDHHPAVTEPEPKPEPQRVVGIDWGDGSDVSVSCVYEVNKDGSLSPVNVEVTDGKQEGEE